MTKRLKLSEVYTVQDLSDGSWATWLATEGSNDTFILSLLCQRENSEVESYRDVARAKFLSDGSLELAIFYGAIPHRMDSLAFLPAAITATGIRVRGHDGASVPEGFRILPATVCRSCGRMLTKPVSIDAEMGEICSGHKPRDRKKFRAAKLFKSPEEMRKAMEANRAKRKV
jgi:hypothetical protein